MTRLEYLKSVHYELHSIVNNLMGLRGESKFYYYFLERLEVEIIGALKKVQRTIRDLEGATIVKEKKE